MLLVTGASGLIGSYLCQKLIGENQQVLGLVHNRTNPMIESLMSHKNFSIIRGDIRDRGFIKKVFKDNNIDTVFHLAAHIPNASDLDYAGVNVKGTYNLLVEATFNKVERFIYASSMSVYSEPPSYLPVDEKHPTYATNLYGKSKLAGELLCDVFSKDMLVTIVRYASVYGKGSRKPLVVANFVDCAMNNLPITIHGDGGQSRDFVYVTDVAEGTLLAWEKGISGIYNIGTGEETTILELAQCVKRVFNSKSEILFVDADAQYPFRFFSDITKAKCQLGYSPMNLNEGLSLYGLCTFKPCCTKNPEPAQKIYSSNLGWCRGFRHFQGQKARFESTATQLAQLLSVWLGLQDLSVAGTEDFSKSHSLYEVNHSPVIGSYFQSVVACSHQIQHKPIAWSQLWLGYNQPCVPGYLLSNHQQDQQPTPRRLLPQYPFDYSFWGGVRLPSKAGRASPHVYSLFCFYRLDSWSIPIRGFAFWAYYRASICLWTPNMSATSTLECANSNLWHNLTSIYYSSYYYILNIYTYQGYTLLTNNLPYVILILGKMIRGYDMEAREERGLMIAATSRIQKNLLGYKVPSQSGNGTYIVSLDHGQPFCTCPDFEARQQKCKHIYAVEYTLKREQGADGRITETRSVKITYGQDWTAYNDAQQEEKSRFMMLLADLCNGLSQPEQTKGRPRLPLSDMAFASIFKVYTGFSSRRFTSDMEEATVQGLISRTPHFNSVSNYISSPEITPILKSLVTMSSLPLRAVETDFAVDSSGFATCVYDRWYDAKYGKMRNKNQWVKAHLMCGVNTHIITSVEITPTETADAPQFKTLVKQTAVNFPIREVSADKAYSSRKNLHIAESLGAVAYIPFKSNTNGIGNREDGFDSLWNKMWHYYNFNRINFMAHYHKRSNAETVFSMIKAKFGGFVRSKSAVAQMNEVLCKVICHNICVLIQSMHELGIEPVFSGRN